MPQASIVIVNFNSGPRLAKCVAALASQTYRDFEVVIIDNASDDSSFRQAIESATSAGLAHKPIESAVNLGFAAGNNRAVGEASGTWLVFLNPDAYPEKDWLEELLRAAAAHPEVEAFGSTQLDAEEPNTLDGAGDVYHALGIPYRGGFGRDAAIAPPTGECFAPCGAAAMYRRDAFLRLGGFDERFFCYSEDVDLGYRLRLQGGKCVQVREAVIHHEGSGISGRYSDFTVYHGNRNRIWVAFKNTPSILYWPMFPFQMAANFYLLLRAFTVGTGRAYLRALVDGYRGLPAFVNDRRSILASRRASIGSIAASMAWNVGMLRSRAPKVWPVS